MGIFYDFSHILSQNGQKISSLRKNSELFSKICNHIRKIHINLRSFSPSILRHGALLF